MVSEAGEAYVPVTNVSYSAVKLTPRRVIAAVTVAPVVLDQPSHAKFCRDAISNEFTGCVPFRG